MNEVSLKPVIEELEDLFSKFNTRFFADKLEKPVITVSPDHTRGAYGWCTGWKAWKAGEDEGHYEINLCAEYLNRPFEETCGTLIHEMVHLQNLQDGVQDTSRSGTYHNKKFTKTITGTIDEVRAVEQAVFLILNVERYEWLIYSWNYGFEKKSLIGKPVDFCIPEIERRVKEALLQDDRITAVENFQFEVNKKKVLTTFTVISIFGPIFTEMEVET